MWTTQVEADGIYWFSESFCTIHLFKKNVYNTLYCVCLVKVYIFGENNSHNTFRLKGLASNPLDWSCSNHFYLYYDSGMFVWIWSIKLIRKLCLFAGKPVSRLWSLWKRCLFHRLCTHHSLNLLCWRLHQNLLFIFGFLLKLCLLLGFHPNWISFYLHFENIKCIHLRQIVMKNLFWII